MNRDVLEQDDEVLEDEKLQHRITERLEEDPAFHVGKSSRTRLSVEVEDGEVTLGGSVRTARDRRRADILARALGATTVHNRLRVEEETTGRSSAR